LQAGPPATLSTRLQRCSSFGQVALRDGDIQASTVLFSDSASRLPKKDPKG
jgi:hypothetical protein